MTEKELLESIKRDTGKSEEEIREFCERNDITLLQHRLRLTHDSITREVWSGIADMTEEELLEAIKRYARRREEEMSKLFDEMTEEELLESIKHDSRRSEEEIWEFCEHNDFTLQQYRIHLDIAMISRGYLNIDADGNRIVNIPESIYKHLEDEEGV